MQLLTAITFLDAWRTFSAIWFWFWAFFYMRYTFVHNFRVKVMLLSCLDELSKIREKYNPVIRVDEGIGNVLQAMHKGDFSKVADLIGNQLLKMNERPTGDLELYKKLPGDLRLVFSFKRLTLENYFDDTDTLRLMLQDLRKISLCPKCKDKNNYAHLCRPVDIVIPDAPYLMQCPAYHCDKCDGQFSNRFTQKIGRLALKTNTPIT